MLLKETKEQTTDLRNNMDGSVNHYTEQKKTRVKKKKRIYDPIYCRISFA